MLMRPMGAGKWMGHNTDGIGFAKSIRPFLTSKHDRALILGNGGAAAAVRFCTRDPGHRSRTRHTKTTTIPCVPFASMN